jgi:membrane protease YdiL (CAAX protease family)
MQAGQNAQSQLPLFVRSGRVFLFFPARSTMEPETSDVASPVPAPNLLKQVFYNDRGLRAGWRLLIFCAMIGVPALGLTLLARMANGGAAPQRGPKLSDFAMTAIQALSELVLFLVILLFTWIMSKIERQKMGVYGLPLRKSLFSSFGNGYLFWGFLPLVLLLFVLHTLHVFDFGSFSPINGKIFGWAILWAFVFLLVGFFEEYCFRGYFLYTLSDGIGFWPAAIIQAILFACIHMGNGGETKVGIIAAGVFALFAAATIWKTGNLWLAVGSHAGWDWGQTYFFGVNDSGFQAPGHLLNPSTHGPDWLSGGSVGPEGSVVTLVFWMLMFVAFLVFYKKYPGPALVITEAPKY